MTHPRVLCLADTHLGFDMPSRPRIKRPRRGPDFFDNYLRALEPARKGLVDLVIHGGDMFYRHKIPAQLVTMAFEPLFAIADKGIPVFVVPGNHERSEIPFPLLAHHEHVHIFDQPSTVVVTIRGTSVAVSGFPFQRGPIRRHFRSILNACKWSAYTCDARLLIMHQSVDGAKVGPNGYTFRHREDVIDPNQIPSAFDLAVSGHIHRAQLITRHLNGRDLPCHVVYPGSIERTSFAERNETKGYLTFQLTRSSIGSIQIEAMRFHPLPSRPMIQLTMDVQDKAQFRQALTAQHPNSIVKVRGPSGISAQELRNLAPENMIVTLVRPTPFRTIASINEP